mmetsp:Transcript_9232/g.25844  ORF Transcript_9232/g.25844 Transcript_9232/m.25844 type:complete len:216 (-) Transcript_9232:58-705(-)
MSLCRVADVKVLQPNASVDEDLAFEVTMDVAEPLAEDAVFRCMYVVDPSKAKTDVELESIDVGNGPGLPCGLMKFVFESPAPSRSVIEAGGGALEVAGLYISAVYRGVEFCRVGYFVRHEYDNPALQEDPPEKVDWSHLRRVLSDPCVTRFSVVWDKPLAAAVAAAPTAEPADRTVGTGLLEGQHQGAEYDWNQRERSRSPLRVDASGVTRSDPL